MKIWLPFNVPYRWKWRTAWTNLDHIAYDLRRGVSNIVRWFDLVWFDRDFDWAFLARIMEWKLRRMADAMERGYHVGKEVDARRCRMCAVLLRRLQDDDYFDSARTVFGRTRRAAEHAKMMQKQDQRYLGMLLGKYLTHWWN